MGRARLVGFGVGICVLAGVLWFAEKDSARHAESLPPAQTELAAATASELASFDLRAPVRDAAAARELAQVSAGARLEVVPREADVMSGESGLWRWEARLRLLDGTPEPRGRFVALTRGAPKELSRVHASARPQPPEILARGSSDDEGLLVLDFPITALGQGGADLHQLGGRPLDPPRFIDFSDPQPVELVYPAGALDVLVLDEYGAPVPSAQVIASWAPSVDRVFGGRTAMQTNEWGKARLIFRESGIGEIVALDKHAKSMARLPDVHFEPTKADDAVTLVLSQQGLTAQLRVHLSSPAGDPIRDFNLQIESDDVPGFYRHVDSATIGPDGIVGGLPPGPATVSVTRVSRDPPSLLRYEEIAPVFVDLHKDRIAEFRVAVSVAARWRVEVRAGKEKFAVLELFTRRTDQGSAEWQQDKRVWQFLANRAMQGVFVDAPGVYYSHEMDPGNYELELRRRPGGEAVWRSSVTLVDGEITRLTAQL